MASRSPIEQAGMILRTPISGKERKQKWILFCVIHQQDCLFVRYVCLSLSTTCLKMVVLKNEWNLQIPLSLAISIVPELCPERVLMIMRLLSRRNRQKRSKRNFPNGCLFCFSCFSLIFNLKIRDQSCYSSSHARRLPPRVIKSGHILHSSKFN